MGQSVSIKIDGSLSGFFRALGNKIARRPGTTIILVMLFAMACMSGVVKYETESRPNYLWTPQGTAPQRHNDLVSNAFERAPRSTTIYIKPKNSNNMLTVAALSEVLTVVGKIQNTVAEAAYKAEDPVRNWTWTDLCYKPRGTDCSITSVLSAWNYNATTLAADTDVGNTLTVAAGAGSMRSADGREIKLTSALGGLAYNASNTLKGAELLTLTLQLDNRAYLLKGEDTDPPSVAFEKKMLENIGTFVDDQTYTHIIIYPNAPAGNQEESGRAIKGDLGLVGGSIMMIVFYMVLNLGPLPCARDGKVKSRTALAAGGLLSVGLALGLAYGLGSLLSKYSPVHSVLPFLIMGIGVDDIFVIINEFDLATARIRKRKGKDYAVSDEGIVERVSEAMGHAGASITATTLTDFLAFVISSATVLPALSSFCIWAAFAVMGAYIFTCTLFVSFLVYDSRRQAKRRADCCCCCKVKEVDNSEEDELKQGFIGRCLADKYMPCLMRTPVKVVVVLVFAGFLGAATVGLLDMKQNFRREWFIPGDSYLQEYYEIGTKYYGGTGLPVSAYALDVNAYEKQNLLRDMGASLRSSSQINSAIPVTDWFAALEASYIAANSANISTATATQFDAYLTTFLSQPQNARYARDLVFSAYVGNTTTRAANSTIKFSRQTGFLLGKSTAEGELEQMNAITGAMAAVATAHSIPGEDQVFAFAFAFPSWAQYAYIPSEAVQNVGLTLLAVFLVILVVVAHPLQAVLVTIVVGMNLVDILGFMTHWQVDLNGVSVVNLVLSIGLAVDYSSHIAHAFMHKQGDRNTRASLAVSEMGVSVINGAFSTFLAVCLLGMSKSYVFVVFFKMFLLTCFFGASHGLVFLPVILSIIGPAAYPDHAHGDSHEVKRVSVSQKDKEKDVTSASDVEMMGLSKDKMSSSQEPNDV